MTTTQPLVAFEGITRHYGEGGGLVRALAGVDLNISRGEFIAIMGPSGSGKSTAMNIIGCLDRPSSGVYRFNGVDVTQLTQDQRALLRRNYLGFVFQGYNLLARTSAVENVELPLVYRGVPAERRRRMAMDALAKVGLQGREHHAMVQRVMFRWAPLRQGIACIDGRVFCPWLASRHIQAFYDALPYLESLLRVLPGVYSMWLRMWGSRVGYGGRMAGAHGCA